MLDVKPDLVEALEEILPSYYELIVDNTYKTPCITYLEKENRESIVTKAAGVSKIAYTIKLWCKSVEDVANYSEQIDEALRKLNYKRTNANEISIDNQICRILTYEALGLEIY